MLSDYFPSAYLDDALTIPYERLLAKGYRALIFDIDNTLVPHGADSTPAVDDLFARLHAMGFKTLLLSNNSASRIQRFNQNIGTLFIEEAGKPQPQCFLRAVDMLGVDKNQVLVVGDTVFTDILGANRAGLRSILVKYIGHERLEWKGFHRYMEVLILLCYRLCRKADLGL